jgi:hypothetical protein
MSYLAQIQYAEKDRCKIASGKRRSSFGSLLFSRRLLSDLGPNDDARLIFININRVLKQEKKSNLHK